MTVDPPARHALVVASQTPEKPELDCLEEVGLSLAEALVDLRRGGCEPSLGKGRALLTGRLSAAQVVSSVTRAIETARDANAVLVLAFLGHGFVQEQGRRLYFMTSDTRQDTPTSAVDLNKLVADACNTRGVRGVLGIIDTCTAASAFDAVRDIVNTQPRLGLLAASAALSQAFDLELSTRLVALLTDGIEGAPETLSVGVVANALKAAIPDQIILPLTIDGQAEDFWVGRNPAHPAGRPEMSLVSRARAQLSGFHEVRAPILIGIESESHPLIVEDMPPTDRHLAIRLTDEDVVRMASVAGSAGEPVTIDAIQAAGREVWEVLTRREPRIATLVAAAAATGIGQPVGWCGRPELLDLIGPAIGIAYADPDTNDGPKDRVPAGHIVERAGSHYLHPIRPGHPAPGINRRGTAGVPRVKVLGPAGSSPELPEPSTAHLVRAEILVMLGITLPVLADVVNASLADPDSPTRVVCASLNAEPRAADIDALLGTVPFVSILPRAMPDVSLIPVLTEVLPAASTVVPPQCVISAVRNIALEEARARDDAAAVRALLTWSNWSWVGLPLFSPKLANVAAAAYPHLMDLRTVTASTERYFPRSQDIDPDYRVSRLVGSRDKPSVVRHLYLSGAGGTGKSCFMRNVYDNMRSRSQRMAVWYCVDAPNSAWDDVARSVRHAVEEEIRRLLPGARGDAVVRNLTPQAGVESLGTYLNEASRVLRDHDVAEISIFIDQLERTFESGDEPNDRALRKVSAAVMEMLDEVGTDGGVRIFIASRKQYLPDFLTSYKRAQESGLHFHILQSLPEGEHVLFVEKVIQWCISNGLVRDLTISDPAATRLGRIAGGHPLNLVLALINLLSARPAGQVLGQDDAIVEALRHRFDPDLRTAERDPLAAYFIMGMAHARAEIVRVDEVWWRLRMVDAERREQAERLRGSGVLERLWMLGLLGRTLHLRPGTRQDVNGEELGGFVEFFHANLRDYLLREVMAQGGDGLDTAGRIVGTPPAWRALDRLAAHARGWRETRQLLSSEEVAALIEHHEVVVQPFATPTSDLHLPAQPFQLLFLRDDENDRESLSNAAMECFALSALRADRLGRWAMKTLFDDESMQVKVCQGWLPHATGDVLSAVLRFLVEMDNDLARALLAGLVFEEKDHSAGLAQAVAATLAEPLNAARYRNEVIAYILREAFGRDRGRDRERLSGISEDLARFLADACGRNPDELTRLLEFCQVRIGDVAGVDLRAPSIVRDILASASAGGAPPLAEAGDPLNGFTPTPTLSLAVGAALRGVVDQPTAIAWSDDLRARLGTPLPDITIVPGECDDDELVMRIRGQVVSVGRFPPGRLSVLWRPTKRVGEDEDPSGRDDPHDDTIVAFDHGFEETLLWIRPDRRAEFGTEIVRGFEESIVDWIESHCRHHFDLVFDIGLTASYLRDIRIRGDESFAGGILRSVQNIVVELIHDGVCLAGLRGDILEALLDPRLRGPGIDRLTVVRLRIRAAICRSLQAERAQVPVIMFSERIELDLVRMLDQPDGRRRASMSEVRLEIIDAVLRCVAEARVDELRSYPILVTVPTLRPWLARLLRPYDRRLRVLSFPEIVPEMMAVPEPNGLISTLVRVPAGTLGGPRG